MLKQCKGFEWDQGNNLKNWLQHAVTSTECEQIFFNEPLIIANDEKHSQEEIRFFALGKTNLQRLLMIVFTIRNDHIRVISARDMSKKERTVYNEKNS